jgi:hypothetical protein
LIAAQGSADPAGYLVLEEPALLSGLEEAVSDRSD